jgi:adenylate cyclase
MANMLAHERHSVDPLLGSDQGESPMLILAGAALRYECNGERKSYPINHLMICTIGRNNVNSIALQDNMLSREHAMIRCSATGVCELTDLGSSNGTRLNDVLLADPVRLKNGDVIQVGQHLLMFEQDELPVHLMADENDAIPVTTDSSNSLITALSINIRGYAQLLQILGEETVAALLADVAAIAAAILTKRKSVRFRHEGTATHAIWAHQYDRVDGRDLLNIFDAIAEIQNGLRPLQKKYHLLRPLGFGCGLASGPALLANISDGGPAEYPPLCNVVERAYRLELATHRTGCDVLMSQSGLELLSPQLPRAGLPDLCTVSSKDFADAEPAHALRFEQLGALSAQVARGVGRVSRLEEA